MTDQPKDRAAELAAYSCRRPYSYHTQNQSGEFKGCCERCVQIAAAIKQREYELTKEKDLAVSSAVAAVREEFLELVRGQVESLDGTESEGSIAAYHQAKFILEEMELLAPNHASAIAEIERRAIERLECCCFELQYIEVFYHAGQITVDETLACPRCEALMEKEVEDE